MQLEANRVDTERVARQPRPLDGALAFLDPLLCRGTRGDSNYAERPRYSFDLRHLRYVRYLNNGEGRQGLRERLEKRLGDLTSAP